MFPIQTCYIKIVSLTPYITLTRGLLLPEEPDLITSMAGPSLRRSTTVIFICIIIILIFVIIIFIIVIIAVIIINA